MMLRCRVFQGSNYICNMLSQHSPPRIPAKLTQRIPPCDLLPPRRNTDRYRPTQNLKFSVSIDFLCLRANQSTTLKLCQSCSVAGTVKLVAFQGFPSVYLPKEWSFGVAGGPAFTTPGWNSWKSPTLLGKQMYYCVRAAAMSSQASELGPKSSSDSSTAARTSRAVQGEAQEALLDYLHGTRSFLYADAEYVSRNSPIFLQSLLAKVEDNKEVSRAIRKFLMYNPINEFEPFLESLGLKPCEIHPILPRGLFFLSDDDAFLENFHVLYNYGVPRSKIGKIYKEAREIFRYDYGVLASKLRAYEELGLSIPTVIKLVLCCPSLLVDGINKDFAQVLEKLKCLGFRHSWIRACLLEQNTYHWDKMLRMLGFLEEMGCNKEDMRNLIKGHPWFLFNESGKKVYVVVSILLKLGLKMNRILHLFLQYPQVVSGSFVKNLYQSIHFLSEIGMEPEGVASIVCTHPQAMGYCLLKKPEDVLSSLNVDRQRLCEIIEDDPNQLRNLASKLKIKPMLSTKDRSHPLEKTTFLLKLGFLENTDEMVAAQKLFRGRGDQLQQRFDVLVKAGLDFRDASHVVKEAPQVLNQNVDVLEKKLDYLVNCAGYPLSSIVNFPTYLCYNLDKIKLRFLMFQWLREKGAVKPTLALSSVIASSQQRFEKFYVNQLPEGPEMWENFKKSCPS